MESWWILLHIAATLGWDAQQIDIKMAFLYGLLPDDETQYMEQPKVFEEPGKETMGWNRVGEFGIGQWMKPCYHGIHMSLLWNVHILSKGTKQHHSGSGACWWFSLHRRPTRREWMIQKPNEGNLEDLEFGWSKVLCRYWNYFESKRPYHLLIPNSSHRQNNSPVWPTRCLSSQLTHGSRIEALASRQKEYLNRRSGMTKSNALSISCWMPNLSICWDVSRYHIHRPTTVTIPQFLHVRSLECHYPSCALPKRNSRPKLTLGGHKPIRLLGLTDSDWANCLDMRRSIGGYGFTLGSGLISWTARKQEMVATSSCKAEYTAAFEAAKETIWLRNLLINIGFPQNSPTTILCDNNAAINLSEDPSLHQHVKHIDIKYHFLREHINMGEITLKYINTNNNLANIFTKAIEHQHFSQLRKLLGLK